MSSPVESQLKSNLEHYTIRSSGNNYNFLQNKLTKFIVQLK